MPCVGGFEDQLRRFGWFWVVLHAFVSARPASRDGRCVVQTNAMEGNRSVGEKTGKTTGQTTRHVEVKTREYIIVYNTYMDKLYDTRKDRHSFVRSDEKNAGHLS